MNKLRGITPILHAAGALLAAAVLLHPSALSGQSGREQVDSVKPLIQIRFARQTPAPGFRQLTVPRSGNAVFVSDRNLFTDGDFVHVQARKTTDGLILRAQWKPPSARRMASIKRGEEGAGNDFLAVFVDGKLVSAPRLVVDSLASAAQVVDIGVQVPPEQAERIAQAVAARWSGGDKLE